MDTIIQQASTLFTLFITDVIKTDNRALDNTIVTLISVIAISYIKYLFSNWRRIYNMIIYWVYDMHQYPHEMWRAPYMRSFIIAPEELRKFRRINYVGNLCFVDMKDVNFEILSKILTGFINKNVVISLTDSEGVKLRGLSNNGMLKFSINGDCGLFLISFDKYGNSIYLSTDGDFYYKDLEEFGNLSKYFNNFIKEAIETTSGIKSENPKIYAFYKKASMKITGEVSAKKTFDNLFYTQKKELIYLLEKFKTKTLYPSHIPMDNKLGILLYGPPGTGKTGTISAIANYLNRNVLIINFATITTITEFEEIFQKQYYKHSIFVFDEFDCLLDVLVNSNNKEVCKTDWSALLLAAEGDERKQIIEMMKNGKDSNAINIAYLLQKLDGLESAEERIIIATTNNPDKINPALLRPGRFDLKLCLGNCSKEMYCEILENYYKGESDIYKRIQNANIEEFKYSPLEIINMAMQHNTIESLIKYIHSI